MPEEVMHAWNPVPAELYRKEYGPVAKPDRAVLVFEVAFGGLPERALTVKA
jgi:hypothetical protein